MTELFDLSDLPEPAEYHEHGGEEVPVYLVHSLIQEAGKEPENIEFGLLCVACGLTPSLCVARMWLETGCPAPTEGGRSGEVYRV